MKGGGSAERRTRRGPEGRLAEGNRAVADGCRSLERFSRAIWDSHNGQTSPGASDAVTGFPRLSQRGAGLRVLAGQGVQIDTATPAGRLVFGIFAALAEFERTLAGLEAARAKGRKGGRKFALTKAQVRLA